MTFPIPPNSTSLHSVLLPRVIGIGQQQWPETVPQASSQPGSATASLYVPFPFWISPVHSGGSFSVPRETCLLKLFARLTAWPLCVLIPSAPALHLRCRASLSVVALISFTSTHSGARVASHSSTVWEKNQGCSVKALYE